MSGVILSQASLIPLDDFLGTWLIGFIVSSVLFGVICLQVYLYFTKHCARDPVFLKTFVALLLALDTAVRVEDSGGIMGCDYGGIIDLFRRRRIPLNP